MLKTCFTFLLTRLSPAYKKNFTQTRTPPPQKKNLTQLKFIFIMVWLLLKTGKNIMANRIPNVPSCFVFFFFESENGRKKRNSINACHKDGGGIKFTSPCLRGYRIFWHGVSEVKIRSQGSLGVMGTNLNILNSNLVSVQHTRLLLKCAEIESEEAMCQLS